MKKFLLAIFIFVTSVYGFDKISFEYSNSDKDIHVYGISLIKNIDYELIKNTNLSWEFTIQGVKGEDDDMFILSTQPLLNYFLTERIYLEGGIGVAYFSEKNLDNKRYGTNFQFKESFGFGYKFSDNLDATLKYTHYSNANINDENAGIDLVGLRFIYSF